MQRFDLVLRLIYCAVAPLALAAFATQVPVAGIALGAVIGTLLAVTEGARWRDGLGRLPLIGRVFHGPGAMGAYYREHPPKPLIYYIAYPLLLPYVLFKKPLREEWRLYRKSSVIALAITIGTAALEYMTKWRPELPFSLFASQFIAVALVQLFLTMIVIMPLVTTIMLAHARERRVWIRTLAVVVGLGSAASVAFLLGNPRPSSMIDRRLYYRANVDHKRTVGTMRVAATRAAAEIPVDAPDGFVHGAPLAAARRELRALWKADEVEWFGVWTQRSPRVVMVVEVSRHHRPLAFAVDEHGGVVVPAKVPPAGQAVLRRTKLPR